MAVRCLRSFASAERDVGRYPTWRSPVPSAPTTQTWAAGGLPLPCSAMKTDPTFWFPRKSQIGGLGGCPMGISKGHGTTSYRSPKKLWLSHESGPRKVSPSRERSRVPL